MRRGATSAGVVVAVIVVVTLALAGCAGSHGGPSTRTLITHTPHHSLAAMRGAIERNVNADLAHLKAPPKTIACVDRNIETMSARQIADRIIQARTTQPRSIVEYLGPLGKGCP